MLFRHSIAALPSIVTLPVFEIVGDAPEGIYYDIPKSAVISGTYFSQENRLQQLLSLVDLGDRIPSQLHHYIRNQSRLINFETIMDQISSCKYGGMSCYQNLQSQPR
nr:Gag protein [Hymenolepis microstoma]